MRLSRGGIGMLLLVVVLASWAAWRYGTRPRQEPSPPPVVGMPQPGAVVVLHGRVEAAGREAINALVSGTVAAVLVTEGQPVVEGEELAQVSSPQLQQRLREAQAALKRAQQRAPTAGTTAAARRSVADVELRWEKSKARTETTAQELASFLRGRQDVANALDRRTAAEERARHVQAAYLQAKSAWEKCQRDYPGQSGADLARREQARSTLRAAQEQNDLAQSQVAEARQIAQPHQADIFRLEALRRAATEAIQRQQTLEKAVARLRLQQDRQVKTQGQSGAAAAQARLKAAEAALGKGRVRAPRSGRLVELQVRAGKTVKAGDRLGAVELQGGARLVCQAGSDDLTQVQVGQEATVRPERGAAFEARVAQVDVTPTTNRVVLTPLGTAPLPPPGMSLTAHLRRLK